jgi:hypothetical protein
MFVAAVSPPPKTHDGEDTVATAGAVLPLEGLFGELANSFIARVNLEGSRVPD